jgi:hypothetical protein
LDNNCHNRRAENCTAVVFLCALILLPSLRFKTNTAGKAASDYDIVIFLTKILAKNKKH